MLIVHVADMPGYLALAQRLFTGDATPLRRWMQVRPHNAVTVLDTHDGIGVRDVGRDVNDPDRAGLLDDDAVDALVEQIHDNTNGESRQATGAAASNVDLYQVNSTYYDALGRDDDAYLLARALQLCTPGVPQIYYVGLLAGANDMDLLAATGVGRDINRHHYSDDEVDDALRRPVVQRLLSLIRFRNRHPAFAGSCHVTQNGRSGLVIRWEAGADRVERPTHEVSDHDARALVIAWLWIRWCHRPRAGGLDAVSLWARTAAARTAAASTTAAVCPKEKRANPRNTDLGVTLPSGATL